MAKLATILSFVAVFFLAVLPAQAQECTTTPGLSRVQALLSPTRTPLLATPSKANVEARVAAIDAHLPTHEALRCLTLASMRLLPSERRTAADEPLSHILDELWNGAGWDPEAEILFSYNPDGTEAEVIERLWFDGAYINAFKTIFLLTEGELTGLVFQEWDEVLEDWVNAGRFLWTFDASENLTQSLAQEWDEIAEDWIDALRSSFSFDAMNNNVGFLTEFFEEGAWIPATQGSTTFDSENRPVEAITEAYDEASEMWEQSFLTAWTYSDDGLTAEALESIALEGELLPFSNTISTWNEQGLLLEEIDQTVNFQTMMLVNSARTSYTYNAFGLEATIQDDRWVMTDWEPAFLLTSTYDSDNDIIEDLEQVWNPAGKTGGQPTWENSQRSRYIYSASVANENLPAGFAVSALDLFPNPARSAVTIDATLDTPGHLRVDVYDLLGRHVATLADAPTTAGIQQLRWTPGDAPAGLYLVRLEAGAQSITRTVTLLR